MLTKNGGHLHCKFLTLKNIGGGDVSPVSSGGHARLHVCFRVTLRVRVCVLFIYTVSQKKTFPTFLAITRESIDGFL